MVEGEAMRIDIHGIAAKINKLAPAHPIGKLQEYQQITV
jgi:hypothetical protein